MDRLLRLGGSLPGLSQVTPAQNDAPVVDTAEQVRVAAFASSKARGSEYKFTFNYFQVYISSLALLKMLKHGRAGVPMEVMGLMLGEFVDDYTVRVIDVFAMPQTGTVIKIEFLSLKLEYNINLFSRV
jgi:hypothetical protein